MPLASPIIFIVDGDSSVRESLELLIKNEGWQPKTFASAQEFLDCPRAVAPTCLVLDVSLPGLDGLELQKRVAVERTDMPIIFTTGYGCSEDSASNKARRGRVFKPTIQCALLTEIRQALERSRLTLAHEAETQVLRDRYA